MHAIISTIDGQGVTKVLTRLTQEAANEIAVKLCAEQGAANAAEVLETLQEHGVWTGNGWDVTVILIEDEFEVLDKPLTIKQMREMVKGKDNTYIEGVVTVELADMIDNDLEGFLDIISDKLCDSGLLMDSNYSVVGHRTNSTLLVKITGDVSIIIDDADDE